MEGTSLTETLDDATVYHPSQLQIGNLHLKIQN